MPTNKINTTLTKFLPQCYLPLLIIMTVGFCLRTVTGDVDFWAHAAVGRWIVEHHQIPRHTLFLWSANIPWIWHSWLSQVIFYELLAHVSENIGALLAAILTACASVFSIFIWWKIWLNNQQKMNGTNNPSWPMIAIFIVAIIAAQERFNPRPEIFSAVLFAVVLWLLVRGIRSWCELAIIFLTFVLWANLHGGLAVGLAILWISAFCELIQDRHFRQAKWTFAAAFLATIAVSVNPYGWHYWMALKQVGGTTFSYIDEWKPFWKWPVLETYVTVTTFICAIAGLAAWLASTKRRLSHLVWLLMAIILFLIARRNTWTLVQIALAVIAANPQLYTLKPWFFPGRRSKYVAVIGLFIAAISTQSAQFWSGHFAEIYFSPSAVAYLRKIAPGHRIFNNYELSSYLDWKLNGNPPLFIDLLNAYPWEIMENYMAINDGLLRTKTLLENWNCDIVVIPQPRINNRSQQLLQWLNINYPWRPVYSDRTSIIWQKLPDKPRKSSKSSH